MPRLLRTVARTAVIAGTATAVSGSVARHQAGKAEEKAQAQAYEQQQAAAAYAPPPQQVVYAAPPEPAPATPATLGPEAIQELQQLAQLKEQGILTEQEFAAQKAKILGA